VEGVVKMTIEQLYHEFEKCKAKSKEEQLRAKEFKDQIIELMNEQGVDELIIDGLDSLVKISITYPEREVLNKKGLAEALDVAQKELSKPIFISKLTEEGKLTSELIERFTVIEERMQFSAREANPEEDDI
jgi:hypothetical protein